MGPAVKGLPYHNALRNNLSCGWIDVLEVRKEFKTLVHTLFCCWIDVLEVRKVVKTLAHTPSCGCIDL